MATMTSSTVVSDRAQKDARRQVQELHVDSLGSRYQIGYLCAQAFDAAANLISNAAAILSGVVAEEINNNILAVTANGSLAVPKFVYSAVAANVAALRAAYLIATRTEAIMIGDYLSSLTDVQLQNAFGLTAGQVTTLRTNKLTPAANLATSIRAATGQ